MFKTAGVASVVTSQQQQRQQSDLEPSESDPLVQERDNQLNSAHARRPRRNRDLSDVERALVDDRRRLRNQRVLRYIVVFVPFVIVLIYLCIYKQRRRSGPSAQN